MVENSTNVAPTPGRNKFTKRVDSGKAAANCFDFERTVRYLYVVDTGDGGVQAMPVFLVDPCQQGNQPLKTATIVQSALTSIGGLPTNNMLSALNGHWHTSTIGTLGGGGSAVSTTTNDPRESNGSRGCHLVSDVNVANGITIDTRNMATTMSIVMTTSAGTATLTVEASTDAFVASDLVVDSIALAASIVKQYDNTHLGTTLAINPLSFRFVKITAGTAGVGNTTTLDIGIK